MRSHHSRTVPVPPDDPGPPSAGPGPAATSLRSARGRSGPLGAGRGRWLRRPHALGDGRLLAGPGCRLLVRHRHGRESPACTGDAGRRPAHRPGRMCAAPAWTSVSCCSGDTPRLAGWRCSGARARLRRAAPGPPGSSVVLSGSSAGRSSGGATPGSTRATGGWRQRRRRGTREAGVARAPARRRRPRSSRPGSADRAAAFGSGCPGVAGIGSVLPWLVSGEACPPDLVRSSSVTGPRPPRRAGS